MSLLRLWLLVFARIHERTFAEIDQHIWKTEDSRISLLLSLSLPSPSGRQAMSTMPRRLKRSRDGSSSGSSAAAKHMYTALNALCGCGATR